MVIPVALGLVHDGEAGIHRPLPGLCDWRVVVVAAADGIFAFDERQALRPANYRLIFNVLMKFSANSS